MVSLQEQSIINRLERLHLSTHVTALKSYNEFLFAAASNEIYLYNWKERLLLEKEVAFQSSSIHGIRIGCDNNVLFFGAKSLRIYSFNSSCDKRLQSSSEELHLKDWIYDIQWLTKDEIIQNSLVIISAHNKVTLLDLKTNKKTDVGCTENCILYAGSIISSEENAVLIAAGTVFKKILLWSPMATGEECGRKRPFHYLSGHQGVIFSVTYSQSHNLLCSTSDDRSVRLWKIHNEEYQPSTLKYWENAVIEMSQVLFAHESRVWRSLLMENCVLSIGEDSLLCFWDFQGKLLQKKKCHKNGGIWCIDSATIKDGSQIAFTGGSDGGIYVWNITSSISVDAISQISLRSSSASTSPDFPRTILFLRYNSTEYLMVTTDKGWLSIYDIKQKIWQDIFQDDSLASYCVPSLSHRHDYLALGNMRGELTFLHFKGQIPEKSNMFKIHEGKVSSIHWVTKESDYLLTCGTKGHMILWKIAQMQGKTTINCVQELFLPKCKPHWWSTAASYINSKNCLIVGDRGGNLSVFSKFEDKTSCNLIKPDTVHRYIHGENGVTDIQEHNSLIYSAGRDGKVQLYALSDDNLNLLHTIKVSHDLEWIGRMLFLENDLLLLGFHTKYFMVWSTHLESAVMTVECGGGHRSWDFSLDDNGTATFLAIKKKDLMFCKEDLNFVLNKSILHEGISGQEYCCVTYLYSKSYKSSNMSVVACGGEDNALRIIGFIDGPTPQIVTLCSLSGHISSVRAISKIEIAPAYLVVSVGGRSQMIIWKVQDDTSLQCEQLSSHILSEFDKSKLQCKDNKTAQIDPQTRLMDVVISSDNLTNSSDNFLISVACSDGYFRVYSFEMSTRSLNLRHNILHGKNCILTLTQISLSDGLDKDIFYASGSTDGFVRVFSSKSIQFSPNEEDCGSDVILRPQLQVKMHQSGINAMDVLHFKDKTWLVASGGDDNALSIALINLKSQSKETVELKCTKQIPDAHASQITGLKLLDLNKIVTVSIDQRINIWEWSLIHDTLAIELKMSKISMIPDIAYLETWPNKVNSWILLVCGQGLESFLLTMER